MHNSEHLFSYFHSDHTFRYGSFTEFQNWRLSVERLLPGALCNGEGIKVTTIFKKLAVIEIFCLTGCVNERSIVF